jgi:uncharacterized membrane protein YqiK
MKFSVLQGTDIELPQPQPLIIIIIVVVVVVIIIVIIISSYIQVSYNSSILHRTHFTIYHHSIT